MSVFFFFFFSSRRRHTRYWRDWSSDACSSDLLIVTALLTIAGYSISDTIVIFDRMREKMRTERGLPLDVLINSSMNETLSRTVITVLLVQIVCVVLYIAGGPVLRDFAFAMVIGNIFGTYSSIGVAAPLVFEY